MHVKVKAWIKIGNIHSWKAHISFDQFLTLMFSLGRSIGKKHPALLEALARVFNAI